MAKLNLRHYTVLFFAFLQILSSPISQMYTDFDGGYYVTGDPVYFLPTAFTFAVWSILISGMIIYAIYQALPKQREREIHKKVGWPIALVNFGFTAWLIASAVDGSAPGILSHFGLLMTAVIIVIMLLTLIYIFIHLKDEKLGRKDSWLIGFTTNTYLAWICIATIANFTDLLYDFGFTGSGYGEYWTVFVLAAAAVACSLIIFNSNNVVSMMGFYGVILWALFGLFYRNLELSMLVSYSVLAVAIYVGVITGLRVKSIGLEKKK